MCVFTAVTVRPKTLYILGKTYRNQNVKSGKIPTQRYIARRPSQGLQKVSTWLPFSEKLTTH